MQKKFFELLFEHEATGKFIKNTIENGYPISHILRVLERDPENAIDASFMWDSTPEGQAYWEELNYLWHEVIAPKRKQYLVTVEKPATEVTVYAVDCLSKQNPIDIVKGGNGDAFVVSRTNTTSPRPITYTVKEVTEDN